MKGPFRALTVIALLLASCGPIHRGTTGVIEGKVVFRKERLEGALVTATRDLGIFGQERSITARTGPDGEFRLSVPPGSYYLTCTRKPDLYGFFGGNPVNIMPGIPSTVVLRVLRWSGQTLMGDDAGGGVEGIAHDDQGVLGGAMVQVFLDAIGRFRGPAYATGRTGADGRFSLDLPPGRYFVVARLRRGTEKTGPLQVGDRYSYYPGNPVLLPSGKRAWIDLPFLEVEKDPQEILDEVSRGSVVSGRVMRRDARPVAGVYACLYKTPEPLGQPLSVSEATDSEGRFKVRVAGSGAFYLVGRRSIGQAMTAGEYVAFYRGPSGHRLEVEEGRDVTGLVIPWEGP